MYYDKFGGFAEFISKDVDRELLLKLLVGNSSQEKKRDTAALDGEQA